MPAHIAVVDDEEDITQLLAAYLGGHGLRVTPLGGGAALDELMERDRPDLVLLDLGLPGEDGLTIARRLREAGPNGAARPLGLIIVTGRGDAVDKVVGLEIGADDYVTKPFDLRELLARVKAVLRRVVPDPPAAAPAAGPPTPTPCAGERLRFAGWVLDRGARSLHDPAGVEVPLTSGEFDLLVVLALNAGRVLSRDTLLEQTRGRSAAPFDRTIDVQIGRIRRKIEPGAQSPQLLKSVRGAGYVLVAPVSRD